MEVLSIFVKTLYPRICILTFDSRRYCSVVCINSSFEKYCQYQLGADVVNILPNYMSIIFLSELFMSS